MEIFLLTKWPWAAIRNKHLNTLSVLSAAFDRSNQINNTGIQLLIVIIDATWNVNACYYEVSYASASSLRMRRSTSSVLGR